jgi:arginase family enzyme
VKFTVITFPHCLDTDTGTAAGPKALLQAGLTDRLREHGHDVAGPFHVKSTPDEEAAYGSWNKIGLANAQLARLVSEAATAHAFPLLLESNCYAAISALAGLQKSPGGIVRLLKEEHENSAPRTFSSDRDRRAPHVHS